MPDTVGRIWNSDPKSNPWHVYASGYREAADLLAEHLKDIRGTHDFLMLPTVFLYRHYLELRFKELYKRTGEYLDENADYETSHGLDDLWHKVRERISRLFPSSAYDEGTTRLIADVDSVVRCFQDVDPTSQAFRYPEYKDKKQKKRHGIQSGPTLAKIRYLNVRILQEKVRGASELLDGTSYALNEYMDRKNEMMAEGRRLADN